MNTETDSYVLEITEREFEQRVVGESFRRPVLVDFWAPWCGPCKVLGPVLEKIAAEYRGAFLLVKINTDENPGISRYMRIQGIPTVVLIKEGGIADQFTGARSESDVRRFLKKHIMSPEEKALEDIRSLIERGKEGKAAGRLREFLEKYPSNDTGKVLLGELLLKERKDKSTREATELLSSIDPTSGLYERAQSLLKKQDLSRYAGDSGALRSLRKSIEKDPSDWNAHLRLGKALIGAEQYSKAMEHLIVVIEHTKNELRNEAHKDLLVIFQILGPSDPEVQQYRKRLASAIF